MADPINETDGVNLRTLRANRDSTQIINIDSLYQLFQYFPTYGDSTLDVDSTFYIRPRPECSNCWDYKYFGETEWTEWFCAENGNPNLRINANAYSILQIENWDLKFRETADYRYGTFAPPKYSFLAHKDSTFEWQNNIRIDEGITAIGEGAGATGVSQTVISGTVFYPNSATTHEVQDTATFYTYGELPYDNIVLIGNHSQPTADNQVMLGDTTIDQVRTWGYFAGNGFIYYDTITESLDTLYLKHLILSESDTGKVAINRGDSVVWEPKDSIYINGQWYQFSDTIIVGSLDSFYYNEGNQWIHDTLFINEFIPFGGDSNQTFISDGYDSGEWQDLWFTGVDRFEGTDPFIFTGKEVVIGQQSTEIVPYKVRDYTQLEINGYTWIDGTVFFGTQTPSIATSNTFSFSKSGTAVSIKNEHLSEPALYVWSKYAIPLELWAEFGDTLIKSQTENFIVLKDGRVKGAAAIDSNDFVIKEQLDTLLITRTDDIISRKDTVGTIISFDIWIGTSAEYDANTPYNGVLPQATNTIAYILD